MLKSDYRALSEHVLEPRGQYGMTFERGVEIVAKQAAIGRQSGGTVMNYDEVNAFNSIKQSHRLLAVAKYFSPLAGYACKLYTETPPALIFFRMEGRHVQVFYFYIGVQQGCDLCPK